MTIQQTRGKGNQVQRRKNEKKKNIGRFKLFLHGGINTMHKFLCTCNSVCMHVTYMIVTAHAICERLDETF